MAAIVTVALWPWEKADQLIAREVSVRELMGTRGRFTVVARRGRTGVLEGAPRAAEAALREVEARMSAHLEDSEISRFNRSRPGQAVAVSVQTLAVLQAARAFAADTDGAFDVTCRPILELWKQAAERDRPPKKAEIAGALGLVGWDKISLGEGVIAKRAPCRGVDLGGIAKGYGIDRAIEAMRQAGAVGGLVDVGGDVRCFGRRPAGGPWRIGIRDPFSRDPYKTIGALVLAEGAVCTSGNYERYSTIQGRRYSHIVNPRTGRPVNEAPSVTVVAPTAMTADAWATALSVLGREGLQRLPEGVEAMLVLGSPKDARKVMSRGFQRHVKTLR